MTTKFFEDNAIAKRNTVTELCIAWTQSAADIKQAFELITSAEQRLKSLFDGSGNGYGFSVSHYGQRVDFDKPENTLNELRRQTWSAITARLELRKIMSLKRTAEMDKQLETGKDLPEITFENVMAMLESNLNNMSQFLEEKVFECYENLRPRGWTLTKYKTNQKSERAGVGAKVILAYALRPTYTGGFEVDYGHTQDRLRALDQVFHLLDGKPQPESFQGELCDAIRTQTNSETHVFETGYFRGRCFRNGNLHLEFKRADLVNEFNRIAGGMRIQSPAQAA